MSTILKTLGAAALFGLVASAAQAVPVTVSDLQLQADKTVPQTFTFDFTGLAASDGTGGTFTITARGDYGAQSSEYLIWTAESAIDGLTSEKIGICSNAGVCTGSPDSVTVFLNDADYQFTKTYTISGAELTALLADGAISVSVLQGPSVNSPNVKAPPFVEISFSYNTGVSAVPLPAALPLFLSGVGGIGFLARRRKNRSEA